MSSKKKKRHQEYLERQKKKNSDKLKQRILNDPNSTMEEMAKALNIRLK